MKKLFVVGIVLIALGLLALALAALKQELPAPIVPQQVTQDGQVYASEEYGLSFTYSNGYYLHEPDLGGAARPAHAIVLVEDTEENRAVLRGESMVAREGPISITVEVYENPDELPAEDWVQGDANWTMRTSQSAPVGIGQITGVSYTWSGLYEGRSVVVTEGPRAYVFSVTWMTLEDPIRSDFDDLLRTVEIAPAA